MVKDTKNLAFSARIFPRMRHLLFSFFLLLGPFFCVGQSFNRPAKEAIKVPHAVFVLFKEYGEKQKGEPAIPERFLYFAAFNLLNQQERTFVEGLYFFVANEHDSGTLFINRKGKVTILPSETPTDALVAYAAFLRKNSLPEPTQLKYLSAIAAFLTYRYQDQQNLVKSGGLSHLKQNSQ
jgi:hypothetical protein